LTYRIPGGSLRRRTFCFVTVIMHKWDPNTVEKETSAQTSQMFLTRTLYSVLWHRYFIDYNHVKTNSKVVPTWIKSKPVGSKIYILLVRIKEELYISVPLN
jgi:hypothetical protein